MATSDPNPQTPQDVPQPPPQFERSSPRSSFGRFFGLFLIATGGVLLLLFGGCTGLCIISEGIPKRQAEFEVFEVGLAGTAIGGALLWLGIYLRRRR